MLVKYLIYLINCLRFRNDDDDYLRGLYQLRSYYDFTHSIVSTTFFSYYIADYKAIRRAKARLNSKYGKIIYTDTDSIKINKEDNNENI